MVSTNLNSRLKNSNVTRVSQTKPVKISLNGIGTAILLPSGDIRIDYKDGSVLTVSHYLLLLI